MQGKSLVECIPNFSEGRDSAVIEKISNAIQSVEGVTLLDVDPGKATNRTVVTFVGEPEPVAEAAFQAIRIASELIDMRRHSGEHPRMGATDVCPFVPIANMTMEETAQLAHKVGERVGKELGIPVFMYESAATQPKRKNLATIRSGEYEGMEEKLKNPEWKPDYGANTFNPTAGVTAIGARDFLIAYNVNLNTTSPRRANSVAFDVREQGRVARIGDPITGEIVRDDSGEPGRIPGKCKAVKGIGWYIEEYGIAQVSMNLTDITKTPLHMAFEACRESANARGMRVTGSELVGMVPLKVMLDAGKFFLEKQERSLGISEEEIIKIAVKSLGLDELSPFDPNKKIIEYSLRKQGDNPLVSMNLSQFARETASESVAPGGGSVSAYVGALGASLGTMVANLSSHKRGWDDQWAYFSEWAEKGQQLMDKLLFLVDEDTRSFEAILESFRLPKGTEQEKAMRSKAIQDATKYAIQVPFQVMETAFACFPLIEAMTEKGNPNSISDAGVGALCCRAAIRGAWLNVQINAGGLKDKEFLQGILSEAENIATRSEKLESDILKMVTDSIKA